MNCLRCPAGADRYSIIFDDGILTVELCPTHAKALRDLRNRHQTIFSPGQPHPPRLRRPRSIVPLTPAELPPRKRA